MSSNPNPHPFYKSAFNNEWNVAGKMPVRNMRGWAAYRCYACFRKDKTLKEGREMKWGGS